MRIILNKKGQIKIQQMAFMLVALTIFFVLVLLFFLSIRTSEVKEGVIETKEEEAVGIVRKLADTPEFEFTGVSNAIDIDKAMVVRSSNRYRDFWGVESIIIKRIYPRGENKDCEFGNYPNCNLIKIFTNEDVAPITSYVSLCRKEIKNGVSYDKCEIGLVMIEVNKTLE